MKKKSCFTLVTTFAFSLIFSVSAFAGNVFWEPLSYFNPSTWEKADGYSNGGCSIAHGVPTMLILRMMESSSWA